MDADIRSFFEPRFGRTFSDVRLHIGNAAGKSAESIDARAYTAGNHIVFAPGEYAPSSHAGRTLIAHELAHVVQQGASPHTPAVQRQPAGPRSVNPRSLNDFQLAAEYERLLRASDPLEEINFEAVDAEIQRRAAARPQQSSSTPTSNPPSNPLMAAAGHAPGGPYHPPEGTELRCTMLDSCPALSLKINYLMHTIESHIAWDLANPNPAYPGGRHAMEIADLTNAVTNCKQIYTTKCTNQPRHIPVPVPVPFWLPEAAEAGEVAAEGVEAVELGTAAAEGFELADLAWLALLAL